MKKLLGISIVAVLAVAPLMANAEGTYDSRKVTLSSGDNNGVASVSYVQGAYNAAVDVVSEEATARATAVTNEATARSEADTALSNRIGTLAGNGNYIGKDSSVSTNLGALDTAVHDLAEAAQEKLTAGNGVDITDNTVSVKAVSENSGLSVTSSGVQVTADTANIVNGAVTADKLASDSVTTAKIVDANVTADKLASDSVTTAKLASDSVTTAKIADANVTKAKLDTDVQGSLGKADTALQASDIATGTDNGTIKVGNTDVAVKGLGSAAYANTGDFDAAGAAADAETAAKEYADQKLVQVYTTWNNANAKGTVALVDTPEQTGGQSGT